MHVYAREFMKLHYFHNEETNMATRNDFQTIHLSVSTARQTFTDSVCLLVSKQIAFAFSTIEHTKRIENSLR